ncbi:MAG: lysophospholipid acyltransferase family protein [Prevotella sp.]|uniref:lysophospholipid acyltransferase family protein n=1 Tax=Prevotella sp. PTAC TaxID=2736295 RepID=UPI001551EBF2|nr:lysophospholipid acyltransferase family protein [Prevotella sp. PTAC]MCX4293137.1 lysophospholipid acyltransferase family protein [Prevotella sp.]NPD54137.1 1-acyl-sn-glycerol-3-phosphate acyltransferase [Prevotella sp. PTAC]
MKYLYRAFQLLVSLPVAFISTVATAVTVIIGCTVGNGHFWGYYPGKWWSKLMVRIFLLPVTVEGRENLEPEQSYVFVANHQGAFDIFLIYGYLGRNFKWMMKRELERIPFVGYACRKARFIFVDKRNPGKVRETYGMARETLSSGMSLVVFPEGARTFTGQMRDFKKGAFMLSDELQLPIVPLTINGSFDVLPRMKDWHWISWHPLRLTIHQPIYPVGKGQENVLATLRQSYDSVASALDAR